MAEKRRSPKLTLTVPADLRKRMDTVSGVNWSAVAAAAFERKLAELAEETGQKTSKARAQRVRATAAELEEVAKRLVSAALDAAK